ncbi:hypothetical protein LTS18_002693 [Coniosporium uncinatum]|uniref:Uncharacterized protein n=1 Tax=Coniosporium uncinatum TaxID=93489 RepID=A0ACC3DCJ7_9PEZI|nr:hypothetical protein LTS18_002693 [Coniosporium uncinatum]
MPGVSASAFDIPLRPYRKGSELILQSSAHPRLDYIASDTPDGSAESLLKHYIGIYDPATNELKLQPAPLLTLTPILRPSEEDIEKMNAPPPKLSYLEQRKQLIMEFGTRKAKKAMAALTENAIKTGDVGAEDPVAKATLESMAPVLDEMPTRESMQEAVDANKPRPQPNTAASTPAEVYSTDTLIGDEVFANITVNDWLEKAATGEDIKTSSRFVARRIAALAQGKEVVKLKYVKFMLVLINFHNALSPARGGGRKLPQREKLREKLGMPDLILGPITRKFCDGPNMTKWHVDYLFTHILAMSLVVDDFATDTFDLKEDLRLEQSQVTKYVTELGARTSNMTEREREARNLTKLEAKGHRMAKLRLPLEFPKLRVGMGKKKGR